MGGALDCCAAPRVGARDGEAEFVALKRCRQSGGLADLGPTSSAGCGARQGVPQGMAEDTDAVATAHAPSMDAREVSVQRKLLAFWENVRASALTHSLRLGAPPRRFASFGPGKRGRPCLSAWHDIGGELAPACAHTRHFDGACTATTRDRPARDAVWPLSQGYSSKAALAGYACLVRMEWFESRYTGLFRRADFGMARFCFTDGAGKTTSGGAVDSLSIWDAGIRKLMGVASAEESPLSMLSTLLALKFFRGGSAATGDLLFSGSSADCCNATHGDAFNIFERCLCNQARDAHSHRSGARPAHEAGTAWPYAAGLSDFASTDQRGKSCLAEFPWALVLRPCRELPRVELPRNATPGEPCILVQPGTCLYDVFACPSPGAAAEPEWLQHIGRLISVSALESFECSNDRPLRFWHQPREEDYAIRRGWVRELGSEAVSSDAGHFERLLCRRDRLVASRGGGWLPRALPATAWVWNPSLALLPGLMPAAGSSQECAACSGSEASPSSSWLEEAAAGRRWVAICALMHGFMAFLLPLLAASAAACCGGIPDPPTWAALAAVVGLGVMLRSRTPPTAQGCSAQTFAGLQASPTAGGRWGGGVALVDGDSDHELVVT